MDPRQRTSDRRFFKAISIWLLIGLAFIVVGLVLVHQGVDMGVAAYRRPPLAGFFVIGGVFLATGAWSLARRAIRGPDQPGKRARY